MKPTIMGKRLLINKPVSRREKSWKIESKDHAMVKLSSLTRLIQISAPDSFDNTLKYGV